MAEYYCTASSVVLEGGSKFSTPILYPFFQNNHSISQIAEQDADYYPKPLDDEAFLSTLQNIEIRALRGIAAAQIGRLLRLADMLDAPVAVPRSAELLSRFATELRQATDKLEDALHTIADRCFIDDTKS